MQKSKKDLSTNMSRVIEKINEIVTFFKVDKIFKSPLPPTSMNLNKFRIPDPILLNVYRSWSSNIDSMVV